eukprot:TRINITY_DN11635_c0_g1_i1.p1 TRINITY_DN11635_c0_g1~~TRINITY_DN11635_c0_g1_i1.p1  ORF type:complete len:572 (+),score=91.05 TRINITY_DN11635_c0_g1_i1:1-1716(+)
MDNDFPERKLLTVDVLSSVFDLVDISYLEHEIIPLILNLSTDFDETVRYSCAKALSRILILRTAISDDSVTYISNLFKSFLNDDSEKVYAYTTTYLVPLFCDWSDFHENLTDTADFFANNLVETLSITKSSTKLPEVLSNRILHSTTVLDTCLSFIIERILLDYYLTTDSYQEQNSSIENYSLFTSSEKSDLMSKFNETFRNGDFSVSKYYSWILNSLTPHLVKIFSSRNFLDDSIGRNIFDLIDNIKQNYGSSFATVLRSQIREHLDEIREKSDRSEFLECRRRLYPLHMLLYSNTEEEGMAEYIQGDMEKIAKAEDYWRFDDYIILTKILRILVEKNCLRIVTILDILWNLALNEESLLREASLKYFAFLSRDLLNEEEISTRVLPAIIALSRDDTKEVRLGTIYCLGDLALHISEERTLDKIAVQFSDLINDGSRQKKEMIVSTLASITPMVPSYFRTIFIIPKTLELCKENQGKSETKRRRMINHLLTVYIALESCELPSDPNSQSLIREGLNILNEDSTLSQEEHDLINNFSNRLISETEPTSTIEKQASEFFNNMKDLFTKTKEE